MMNSLLRSRFISFFVTCLGGTLFHRFFGLGRVLNRCNAVEAKNIFELGCGVGITTKLISRRWPGAIIRAIDKDPGNVASAEKRFTGANSQISFSCQDIRTVDLPRASYDIVISSLVLHHIKEYKEVFLKLVNAVKPGGLFVLYDIPEKTAVRFARCRFLSEGVFSADDLRSLALKSGCTIETLFGSQRVYLIARAPGDERQL